MPDPFAIVNVDGEHFRTAVARKTLSPQWMTERDMYISPVHIFVSKTCSVSFRLLAAQSHPTL
jgi:Ca2+-dependent lipid-binding protein